MKASSNGYSIIHVKEALVIPYDFIEEIQHSSKELVWKEGKIFLILKKQNLYSNQELELEITCKEACSNGYSPILANPKLEMT